LPHADGWYQKKHGEEAHDKLPVPTTSAPGGKVSQDFGAGFHVAPGRPVDAEAYDQWTGRWSRLFVPSVLAAAELTPGFCVLDVSTGTGEAARAALPIAGSSGMVVGADISLAMLHAAQGRLRAPTFSPVAADGQALPFADRSFDAVICHLGLQFFPDPSLGLGEFRRVLRPGRSLGLCVISGPERAPMWGVLADAVGRRRPQLRETLHLSFALADPRQLERLLLQAGFRDVRVRLETHEGRFESFDEYWWPIEAGVGSIPQAYLMLSEAERRMVRDEVRARLSPFESPAGLRMSVEMLIGHGRADDTWRPAARLPESYRSR
jgi:ubiquinone/menaquinone biosynthesis C-methylase UbiE